jgi:transposase
VSWARLCPRTIQSGTSSSAGKAGKGNPYLKGVLGLAATTAARSGGTFLAERYRRIVKRRGKGKALVAVARSILVVIWHLLADPTTRYHDLGPDYYDRRVNTDRKLHSLVRQLEALGHTVTLNPTTWPPSQQPVRPPHRPGNATCARPDVVKLIFRSDHIPCSPPTQPPRRHPA